jgi:hypothetical protein
MKENANRAKGWPGYGKARSNCLETKARGLKDADAERARLPAGRIATKLLGL